MSSPTVDTQQQYIAQYGQYFPQGYQQQGSNSSYPQTQPQSSQNDDAQTKALSQQPYQQAASQEQSPEMKQYEEQMRQYNIQLKQYEDYQKALQQQQQQQSVQTSATQKTPEEIRYEQQMKEYQKQKAEFEKYQQDMAEYEKKKQEWERQQRAYPSVAPGPTYGAPVQVPNAFGVSYPPNFGVGVTGTAPTSFAPAIASPTVQFPPNYAPTFSHPYAAAGIPGVFGQQVPVAVPIAGGFGVPSGPNSRSISLPFVHLNLFLTRKNEIENGAQVKLTIRDPPVAGADFGLLINAGSPASLEMATTLIDRLIRSNSLSGGVWRGDQRDVRNAAGVFPAPGVGVGVKDTRERCRDFYSSGVCGRGQRCIFRHESPPNALSKLPLMPMVGAVRPGVPHPLLDNRYARPTGAWPGVDDSRKRMREFEGPRPAMILDPRRPGPFNDVRRFPGSVSGSDGGPYPRFAPKEGVRPEPGSATVTMHTSPTSPNSETSSSTQDGSLPNSSASNPEPNSSASNPEPTSSISTTESAGSNPTSNDTNESNTTATNPSSSPLETSASVPSEPEPVPSEPKQILSESVAGALDSFSAKTANGVSDYAGSPQAQNNASALSLPDGNASASTPISQDTSAPAPAQDNVSTPTPIPQDTSAPAPADNISTPTPQDNATIRASNSDNDTNKTEQ